MSYRCLDDRREEKSPMADTHEQQLYERLQPEQVVGNLLRVGVALTLYELIKQRVLDDVRGFYTFGFDATGPLLDRAAYEEKVRSLNRQSAFKASLEWLKSSGAITSEDVGTLDRLYEYRKAMAHESAVLMFDPSFEIQDDLIASARDVLQKLGRFWARIELDTDGGLDGREIADEDVQSLDVVFFDHIHGIERMWQNELIEALRSG